MNVDPSRFISGIYNYCDRWCERCRFNDRCMVYASELASRERHELKGEDPDDMNIVMEDVTARFAETMVMIQEMAAERGIDLDDLPPDEEEEEALERHHSHPYFIRTSAFMDRIESLIERVREEIPAVGDRLAERVILNPHLIAEEDNIRATLEGVRDAYDVLCHFRYFIVVKTARAVESLFESERRGDSEMAEFAREDARGAAKLLEECHARVHSALWTIGEFHRPWLDDAALLASEGESISQELDTLFPGFRAFHRPGFDD